MLRFRSRTRGQWLGVAAAIWITGCAPPAQGRQTIVVRPGQNLATIVADAPEGTRFLFEPGIYRQQTIRPKNRQEFIGQDGTILNGAMVLADWTNEAGVWKHEDLPDPLPFRGYCRDGTDLCKHREDLFFNGRLYHRVDSRGDLGPGRWYYEDHSAYLADDPRGQLIELGVTPWGFVSDAEGVVLKDLIVEKYATNAQEGAILTDDGRGWRLLNVIARWNHGTGLTFGPETQVEGGSFSHNGQSGLGGSGGAGSRIEGAEIAFNNYAGYNPRWEAGGSKFWATTGLIVRESCVHHNEGPGLWTDNDNIDVLFEENIVFKNKNEGIKHEISYDAIIRDNIVAWNGIDHHNWLWGSQILVQNSRNTEVYGNVVEVPPEFGNGIGVIHQDRGEGAYGPWHAVGNSVHDNTIIHLGDRGRNGIVSDTGDISFWKTADNQFNDNTYVVPDRESEYWTSNDQDETWADVESLGFETSGDLIVEQRMPAELSCHR